MSCGPNSSSSGAQCTITSSDADNLRIDQPFVAGGFYEYQSIVFQPGDLITLNAGGCVQTGGIGSTWKRYVNPTGSNSGPPTGFYYGTVSIPGASYADDQNTSVNDTPISEFVSGQKHKIRIPTTGLPTDTTQHLDLRLGYRDDNYGDNGYYDHDDGNDNQCALSNDGGPAWVTVSVQHGVTGPWPSTNPKPFDVVRSGFDSNLLFKNPSWGWQVNHGSLSTDGLYLLQCQLAPGCTSQATTTDHIGWDLLANFGLCGGSFANSPLGHQNWFDVTYTGQIHWDEWSGSITGDDDYNMLLDTPDTTGSGPAGVTFGNPQQMKLEFDSDETVDQFDQQPWWSRLHYYVDLNDRATIDHFVDGHDAVVTGLLGIDQVHGVSGIGLLPAGGSEVHPVHILAIREQPPGAIDPANDTWVIFARNWGDEGECGSLQHFLDANTVTVDLPRPGNVPADAVGLPTGDNTFYAHGTSVGPAIHPSAQGVQVSFNLQSGADKPFEVGEVHLNWTGGASSAASASAGPAAPARAATVQPAPAQPAVAQPADDGGDNDAEATVAAIWAGMTPAQQQTASTLFDQLRPHQQLDVTPVTAYLSSTPPPAPTGVPTVSSAPDPTADQRLHAQFQALCAATGGNLPTRPDWCPGLNQAPVTELTTTGGDPVVGGWQTTPVTATLTALDAAGSGISRTEYSYDGQTWTPYTGPITLPDGIYTFWYRSQDNKGNLEQADQRSFKIDTRAPVITINQPTPTAYTHSSTLTLDYAVDDGPTTGLNAGSGVASVAPTLDGATTLAGHGLASGQPINLLTELPLGPHTFTVNAADNVGHADAASVTFSIVVTPESIEDDVRQFYAAGEIKNGGIERSLLAKLDAAGTAYNDGDCTTAANIYGAFINELQALSGKAVAPTAAQVMIGDAQYLQTHCAPEAPRLDRMRLE